MSKSEKTTLDLKLEDADPECLGSLPVRIVASDTDISIFPQGFGDFGSADGHGCPVFIELYQGRLRVTVFPDINVEDPTIIDLSGAKEDRRRDTENLHDWTPLQKGRRFHEFMSQINPATGNPFTMNEAATALGVDYATFRNLEALWRHPLEGRKENQDIPKTFEIEQYEICITKYRVEAANKAEAIAKLLDGEAEAVDNSHEYVEIAEDYGLPDDKHPELAEELRALGVQVHEIIPSIRTIEQID